MEGAAAILRDQIMDELMERAMTATELAKELGADWLLVVIELINLQDEGLVRPLTSGGNGQREVPFTMQRTKRIKQP